MKQYHIKVFGQDGTTFVKGLAPSLLRSAPSFRPQINGGLGECVLDLRLPFDDFDEVVSIDFMNICDVYCIDDAHPRGRRIYRGFISQYEPYIEGGEQGVKVTLLGLSSLLSLSYYGTQPSYEITHTAQDPVDIFKAIIDNFNAAFGGSLITYDASSIPASAGTSVTKTYTERKWSDALSDTKDLCPEGWFWKVDAAGKAHLKAKSASPTHTFTLGKDVISLTCPKTSENVINEVIVKRTGGTAKQYYDATSQTAFGTGNPATGRYTSIISDSGIADETTSDQRGAKELADNKGEKISATIVVNSQYDLESIEVGHTCKVRNFKKANTFFGSNNMLIVGITYTPDKCTLELEEHSSNFGLALANFVG